MTTYTNLDAFYTDYPEPYQESEEVQSQEVVLLNAQMHQSNYALFFAHLAENISLLGNEYLEMDLSAIHTVEFTPYIGGSGWWWMDVDVEEMYVLVERDRVFGKCEIVLSDSYKDFRQMYGFNEAHA